jgi:hypothetical protein
MSNEPMTNWDFVIGHWDFIHRLRVLGLVMLAGIKSRMEYRLDFFLRVTMGVVWNLTSLVFIWAVLARFKSMAGWSQEEVFFIYTLRLLAHGGYCLLFHNVQTVSRAVRWGDFDRVLLRAAPAEPPAPTDHLGVRPRRHRRPGAGARLLCDSQSHARISLDSAGARLSRSGGGGGVPD